MARKPIDIGAIGNDGTGDSIRDAFRKVNDNFRELYGSLGLGEKLLFTEFDDTPDSYIGEENSILAVNPTEDGLVFKKIVGGVGVVIDQTDPREIRLSTEFSEIRADPNPQLGGNLNVRSGGQQFRIRNLPELDLSSAGLVDPDKNPKFDDEAVSKEYADTKISRAGVNTINPATGFVTQAFGTMTGPLILSRDPEPEDDFLYNGRIAATKRYVDTAGFSSTVNLYVATSGADDRVGLSKSIQGRSLASSYKTLEAALKRAEEIINDSPIELGPYQKTLTYNGGAEKCTLSNIITSPDSGSGFSGKVFMSVDTVTLDVPGVNYQPGDIITVKEGVGVPARIEVLTTLTTPGPVSTFRIVAQGLYETLPGSQGVDTISNSQFGGAATVNLTYKVNSISITDPGGSLSDPSFSDYGLVSVRISGGGGSGAFGRANVVNGQIDTITITNTGSGFTSLPSLVVDLPRFLIFTNGLRTDFTGDVLTNTPDAFSTRDIREGLLIQGEESGALAIILAHDGITLDSEGNEIFDMDIVSGNFKLGETLRYGDRSKSVQISVLVETGIYEENFPLRVPQNVAIIGSEFRRVIIRPKKGGSSSPWALLKFRRDQVIDGLTVADRLYGYHYLTNSADPVYPKINNPGNFDSAAALLELNKFFIQEEVIAWIANEINFGNPPFTTNFVYNEELCKRDIGLIIDSMVYDLKYGGYARTISAALKYFESASSLIAITDQLSETLAAIEKINELAQQVLRNQTVFPVFNNSTIQIVDESFSSERGSGAQVKNILFASKTNPVRITTTEPHFYRSREKITIDGISIGMTELNGQTYYVKNLNGIIFDLYEDFDLTIPVDGTNFEDYVPNSGGTITPQGGVIGELFEALIDIISGSTLSNPPKDNDEMDMFLCNDAVIIRAVTGQGQGGFMMVLDPEGQVLAKSPYCQESASFSKSINAQTFAGGMFVDGFSGNVQFTHEASTNSFNISVAGLDREPLTPFSFIVNDIVHRVNYFRNFSYDPRGSTADFILDETTPFTGLPGKLAVSVTPGDPGVFTRNDHKLDIKSSIKFFSTETLPAPLEEGREYYVLANGLTNNNFSIGLSIDDIEGIEILSPGSGTISYQRLYEILTPGNRSMLSNDFTQVCDLGYGLIATNGGLTEAVSMFTYYCHISYYSLNGGQIRSVGGSSAHGNYALVAEGADPLEVPTPVTIFDDYSQRVICYAPSQAFQQTAGDLFVFVTGYRKVPLPNSELEVDHGNQIFRYPVTSVSTDGVPDGVARLNLTSDDSGNFEGLFLGIPDGEKLTLRNNGAVVLTGDIVNVTTRPSTGLVLNETSDVYRILQFSEYTDSNAPYIVEFSIGSPTDLEIVTIVTDISSNVCTTVGNHLLEIDDKFIPKITANGFNAGTIYYVISVPNYNQFTLSTTPGGLVHTLTDGSNLAIKGTKTHNLLEDYLIEFKTIPASFQGNISGTTLTVSVMSLGVITPGQIITGAGITAGTKITGYGNGTGGVGTYTVDISQTVSETTINTAASLPDSLDFGERYFIIEQGLTDTKFRISNLRNGNPINIADTGSGLIGYSNVGLGLTLTRENYNYVDLTLWQPGEVDTGPFVCTIATGSPAIITHISHGLNPGDVVRFITTGTLPSGIQTIRNYFVLTTPTSDTFTITTNAIISSATPIDATGFQSGVQSYATVKGLAGTTDLAVIPVSPEERSRVPGSVFYFQGERYIITNYEAEGSFTDPTSTPPNLPSQYARITLSRPLEDDIIKFVSSYTIKSASRKRSLGLSGTLTIRISLTRVTGHDLLDIGTGSYADTNYPNEIFGPPVNSVNASQETEERDVGRVFYVTTDQFGNFRVGPFFEVDQGTGRVTFSAAIALSNLDGIGFKRGVPISEFSVDNSLADNAIDTVPTENAVRGYIERRLGITHTGGNVPSGQLIPPISGGFLPLNGQLPMKNQINMDNYSIVSLSNPSNPQDAVNLRSLTFNNFQDFTGTGVTASNIIAFTGTDNQSINVEMIGDIALTINPSNNTIDAQINSGVIINSDINNNAGIVQSKLSMNAATTRADSTGIVQADTGLASFDDAQFTATNGWITVKNNGLILSKLEKINARSVIGNSTLASSDPTNVTFTTIVDLGNSIKKSQFGQFGTASGFLRRNLPGNDDANFSTVEASSDLQNNRLVQRDSNGDFAARIVSLDQLKIDDKVALDTTVIGSGGVMRLFGYLGQGGILLQDGTLAADKISFYDNNAHRFRTLNGLQNAPIICSSIETLTLTTGGNTTGGTITGRWTLSGTSPNESRLQATYSADLAEYYEGDKEYEVGTVLVFGGDKEVTISDIELDTRIAGVVSNTAAFVMYDACPGYKNLVALQGRVPCKVVGKIKKGDLLVTSNIMGAATTCTDPKVGTIVGKAIENYDSDEVGVIEIAVGRT
jgi:hypothetical protein